MSTHQAQTSIWLEEPALVSLGGWQLNVETGDEVEEGWRPRRNWSRVVEGGGLEIVHEEG